MRNSFPGEDSGALERSKMVPASLCALRVSQRRRVGVKSDVCPPADTPRHAKEPFPHAPGSAASSLGPAVTFPHLKKSNPLGELKLGRPPAPTPRPVATTSRQIEIRGRSEILKIQKQLTT